MKTMRRSIGMVAICLVLVACTSTSPTTQPSPPPTGAPAATTSATPAANAPSSLVIRTTTCSDVCGPNPGTTVLADGRVIWRSDGPAGAIMLERTLTPSGLQAVRDAIDATGLLEADGSYSPTLRLGADPPGHGTTSHVFRVARGDGLVKVYADDPGTFEGDNELLGLTWDIPAATYVLSDLATKLGDPEAWLPADAWADRQRIHEAGGYLLIVTTERSGDLPPYEDVDAVRWPFQIPIEAVGLPYVQQGAVVANSRCLPITRDLAADLAAAERSVRYERSLTAPYTDFTYRWAAGPGSVNVALRQLLPDQPLACVEGGAW